MGIENTLERIAAALERCGELQEKRVALCEQMLALRQAEAAPHAGESAEELNREKLLARCAELNLTVPKGTKTSTLVKRIAEKEAELASASSEESASREVAPAAALTVSASSYKPEPSVQFETLEQLRTACTALIKDPRGVATDAERAAAKSVYDRYGGSLPEVPPERWGEFYADMKAAFEEAHRNA